MINLFVKLQWDIEGGGLKAPGERGIVPPPAVRICIDISKTIPGHQH